METEKSLAAVQLEPSWGDAVNNAGIGRESRLELSEAERKGGVEWRRDTKIVLDVRAPRI